jgi:hypothetical protein
LFVTFDSVTLPHTAAARLCQIEHLLLRSLRYG